MKKMLLFLGVLCLIPGLIGCNTETTEPEVVLSVMVPSGSPALAQIYLENDPLHYDVDVVNGSDPLVAAFAAKTHDVIFAPTNLGAKLYNSGGSTYRFGGTVVWGNYYLVGKGHDLFDLDSMAGKSIIVFGQNQTSDIILRYLLSENDITASLTYVDSVATATAQFLADPSLIILTAEPSLSTLAANVTDIQVIDLQDEYSEITGSDSYPQAGFFFREDLDSVSAAAFFEDLSASVESVNTDPQEAANVAVSLEYPFSASVLVSAIPNSHLDSVSAQDSRTALEVYFTMILGLNGALVGNRLPDDDFYFIP
jgi:NitT/TauT family transport system substrate-binding protein